MNVNFLMQGASFVKKDRSSFQHNAAVLAMHNNVCASVRAQLVAASKAVEGKANTGLNEAGWRPLAEVVGMCSPKSDKLIVPRGYAQTEWKLEIMITFLKTGQYPSSRTDGKGGSVAIKNVDQLHAKGLTSKRDPLKVEFAKLRQVPELKELEEEAL